MKKLLLSLIVLASFNFKTSDTTLSAEERAFAIDQLTKSKEAMLSSIKGLSKDQLNFKSSPASWSIAECAEHIAISENNIFGMVEGALKLPADPSRRGEVKISDDGVLKMITDRTNKVKTSETFEPKNNYGSIDGTVKEFVAKRDAHITFVKNTKDDLRNRYQQLPLGTMDAYQVILFMAGHSRRHTLQIEEVKSDKNFPK